MSESELEDFAQQIADQVESFLVALREIARENDAGRAISLLLLEISQVQERRHLDRLARVRAERDASAHAAAMRRLEDEARRGDVNLMPAIIAAVEAYATIGEMCGALRSVYGEYREPLAV